jgi:predicted AlkP superfamily phosphohydrolase/phosphomutase
MDKHNAPRKHDTVIAIGLDAADPDLIEKWSGQGHLTTISSLMANGSWVRLISTAELSSGATWPSVNTGVSPAKHGIYFYHRQLKNGSYEIIKKYANQIKRDPFWVLLSQSNNSVAILDVPFTRPTVGLNGIQLVGWGVEAPSWKKSSWPPEIFKKVTSYFGAHPLDGWYQRRPADKNEYQELYKKLVSGVDKRCSLSKYILDQERWNLFLTVFAESHWVGHLFWHVMDQNHPDHDPELARNFSNAVLGIYSEIDAAISKLIEASRDCTVLIFSNTGIGPNYSGSHLLPEVLTRLGMTPRDNEKDFNLELLGNLLPAKRWGPNALNKIESMLSVELIEWMKRITPENVWDWWTRHILSLGNNWKWSRAFCLPNDFPGTIRINLMGREPHGMVEPGSEFDSICDELIHELSEIINVDTGRKAVREVQRIDKLYQGENVSDLPDLIVKWTGDAPIRTIYSPRIGTLSGDNTDSRTGAHSSHGFLIASGKHIKHGKTVEGASILDIAPTILYLMGHPIPSDMDGKVLLGIIDEKFKANNPVPSN